ncbi:ABC transporter ATP-binding protein [Endozoicomonas montiporae]|uniref:Phospholipid/cholesterol/gamma-HCH transport system ATP-binding protein n=1 Tax=Endozoicomonas montiporae CL-33 TaxID=570277 RepID=A0A142BAI1_9GAMM|nr:ATP-binding cassette domain-containing protein [Endozoicomonas montiporae]AMO55757.1 phospholipid/cholesterol/gamma-HCH transport system ATP-binding protein [Endozoicomonas montiporae CL-33]
MNPEVYLGSDPETDPDHSPVIEVRNLRLQYGHKLIQKDLNFLVRKGDVFVIMGGSGCGKSTLLKHMIGLYSPVQGQILYHGEDYFSASDADQLSMRTRWGVTYQSGALFSAMTLAENIALPMQQYTGWSKAEISDRVAYKLALVGLAGYEDYYPSEISGGMNKRAGLARALALDPGILFFDEPSAGLDPLSAGRLDELILELSQSSGATVVIVTHELASIFAIGNNGVFLDAQSRTQLDTGAPSYMLRHSKQPVVREFLSRGEVSS